MEETEQQRRARKRRERIERDPEGFAAIQKAARDKRQANGKHHAYTREYRRKNPEREMLRAAKDRATQKGLDFDLDISDIVIPSVCPVLKTPMVSPSLDRKDNARGYVKGNVVVISHRANAIKRDATVEEIALILAYMRG